MPVTAEELEAELREIGERRRRLAAEEKALARDTQAAVKRAKRERLVTMTRVADLVHLDRTYLYRGYT